MAKDKKDNLLNKPETEEAEKVWVRIDGQEYVLKGKEGKDHLIKVAAMVDEKINTIKRVKKDYSPAKIVTLAALQLADELVTKQEENKKIWEEIENMKVK